MESSQSYLFLLHSKVFKVSMLKDKFLVIRGSHRSGSGVLTGVDQGFSQERIRGSHRSGSGVLTGVDQGFSQEWISLIKLKRRL